MRKKLTALFISLVAFAAFAATPFPTILTDTNGILKTPTNFFSANIQTISNAMANAGLIGGLAITNLNNNSSTLPAGVLSGVTVGTNQSYAINISSNLVVAGTWPAGNAYALGGIGASNYVAAYIFTNAGTSYYLPSSQLLVVNTNGGANYSAGNGINIATGPPTISVDGSVTATNGGTVGFLNLSATNANFYTGNVSNLNVQNFYPSNIYVGGSLVVTNIVLVYSNIFYCSPYGSDTTGNGTIGNPVYSPGLAAWLASNSSSNGVYAMADCLPGKYSISPTNTWGQIYLGPNTGFKQEAGSLIVSSYGGTVGVLGDHFLMVNSGCVVKDLNLLWQCPAGDNDAGAVSCASGIIFTNPCYIINAVITSYGTGARFEIGSGTSGKIVWINPNILANTVGIDNEGWTGLTNVIEGGEIVAQNFTNLPMQSYKPTRCLESSYLTSGQAGTIYVSGTKLSAYDWDAAGMSRVGCILFSQDYSDANASLANSTNVFLTGCLFDEHLTNAGSADFIGVTYQGGTLSGQQYVAVVSACSRVDGGLFTEALTQWQANDIIPSVRSNIFNVSFGSLLCGGNNRQGTSQIPPNTYQVITASNLNVSSGSSYDGNWYLCQVLATGLGANLVYSNPSVASHYIVWTNTSATRGFYFLNGSTVEWHSYTSYANNGGSQLTPLYTNTVPQWIIWNSATNVAGSGNSPIVNYLPTTVCAVPNGTFTNTYTGRVFYINQ